MTGGTAWRRGVALVAVTAAALALGGWWWRAAAPEEPAGPPRHPPVGSRAAAPEQPAVPLWPLLSGSRPATAPPVPDRVATPEELRRWRRTIDQILPQGQLPRAAWGRNHVRPRLSKADVRTDWQIDPGRHLLELACVGHGALDLEVDLGATVLRQAIGCTKRGQRLSVSGQNFDGRFAVRAFAGPEAEGFLGYRLTAHAVVETTWGDRAAAALPTPRYGPVVTGGVLVAGGFVIHDGDDTLGAGSYQVTVVCAGRGELQVSTPPGPAGLSNAPVRCRERAPYPRTRGIVQVGPAGFQISAATLDPETLGWLRYLVTPA